MKLATVVIAAFASIGPVNASTTLPAPIAEGVIVEAAWLRESVDGSELYLVVNNLSAAAIQVTNIDVAGMPGTIKAMNGPREALSIPYHSELYMTADGIRVSVPASFPPEQSVPVSISTSTGEAATIEATVLSSGAEIPDHHDYPH